MCVSHVSVDMHLGNGRNGGIWNVFGGAFDALELERAREFEFFFGGGERVIDSEVWRLRNQLAWSIGRQAPDLKACRS